MTFIGSTLPYTKCACSEMPAHQEISDLSDRPDSFHSKPRLLEYLRKDCSVFLSSRTL